MNGISEISQNRSGGGQAVIVQELTAELKREKLDAATKKTILKVLTAYGSILLALALDLGIADSPEQQQASRPYFGYLLVLLAIIQTVSLIWDFARHRTIDHAAYHAPLLGGIVLFLNILNLVTAKYALLPVLYFPTLDRVFGTLIEDHALILKCVRYSARLLIIGVLGGGLVGFFMGVGVGFNRTIRYWINPIVRVLGPIPSTAWIPIVLVLFPSAISASEFIIGIAVWFPVLVMTSSGISNTENVYFEVASTLGAGTFTKVCKIGIPAALPSIFLGFFNGVCASFITLMTAEMIGAKYGIGWYVNWEKDMMSYANVYAGLIVIALLFCLIITILIKGRDRLLSWQKGVIKW